MRGIWQKCQNSRKRKKWNCSSEVFPCLKLILNSRHRRSCHWSCNIANAGDTVPIFHVPTWQVAATTYTCQPQRRPEYFLASSKLSVAMATAYFFVVVVLLATSASFFFLAFYCSHVVEFCFYCHLQKKWQYFSCWHAFISLIFALH